ncbi:chromosome-associated kinesin KIF4-like [Anopheles stephensi]|uniref:chromosome-associated kinesin KIF4-like n=1 Tax=Anopheles stephensi TaxID=30069 RepID=UPI001658B3BD|nr:chromosome-associated kinesin KIF4-like [Anopheles stephensi]
MHSGSVPDTVQVAVRIRPLSSLELASGHHNVIVQPNPAEPRLVARGAEEFTFTEVFGPTVSQAEVYDRSVRGIVLKLLQGFNVSILAYGQTGSGKTYTIGTSFDGRITNHSGILPRALLDIFDAVNAPTDGDAGCSSYRVFCSFMELYQEHVYDLLSHRNRYERLLGIREDAEGVIVPGLTELAVSSAEETFGWLMHGANSRATAPTRMNKESNRSHTIFTVIIRSRRKANAATGGEHVMISKLHFVDLAGSERAKKSRASGDRLRESIQINKGLLALGNVISALASSSGTSPSKSARSTFVSYRDSKLTRLLQNSLGGNSITLMLACVSPADYNIEETISTLRYADRALSIRNKPARTPPAPMSQSSSVAELERLSKTVSELRTENDQLRRRIAAELKPAIEAGLAGGKNGTGRHLATQNRLLHGQLQSSIEESTRNELRASIAENALGRLEPLVLHELRTEYDDLAGTALTPLSGDELRAKCEEILLRYRTEYEALRQRPTAQHRSTLD